MPALLNLFKKEKPGLFAAIDVGSHSIKTAVFTMDDPEKLPKIRKKQVFHLHRGRRDIGAVFKLREILFSIVKGLEKIPDKIFAAFSPPFAVESVSLWKARYDPKKKMAPRRELRNCFGNLFEENREKEAAILAYPVEIFANGYAVSAEEVPEKGVAELAFRVLLMKFSAEAGAALADAKKSLGGLPLEFVPASAVYSQALAGPLGVRDAFLVDVGWEGTSLVLLKDGKLLEVLFFGLGAGHFIRGIAEAMSISLCEAEDLKRQYGQKIVSPAMKRGLEEFLARESGVWKKAFLEKVNSFYRFGPLPPLVFLSGGGARLAEIGSVLRGRDWLGNLSYEDVPEVRLFGGESVFKGDSLGGFLEGPENALLASLIFYAGRGKPIF